MAGVLVHPNRVAHSYQCTVAQPPPSSLAPQYTSEIISQTVHDLFQNNSTPVDRDFAGIVLSDAASITCLKLPSHVHIAKGVMGIFSQMLPHLQEFHLRTGPKQENRVSDEDFLAFAQQGHHLKNLTIKRIPDVTSQGFLEAIEELKKLEEFTTDYPVNDEHIATLCDKGVKRIVITNQTKLSDCYRRQVASE